MGEAGSAGSMRVTPGPSVRWSTGVSCATSNVAMGRPQFMAINQIAGYSLGTMVQPVSWIQCGNSPADKVGGSLMETNKALIRRFIDEVHNNGNVALVKELFAPNYVNRSAAPNAND